MKTETLTAKHKGVECGSKEIKIPETIYEAIELVGEERALDMFIDGYKISERSSLYPTPEGKPSKILLRMKEVYENIVKAGVPPEAASKITGYTPAQ